MRSIAPTLLANGRQSTFVIHSSAMQSSISLISHSVHAVLFIYHIRNMNDYLGNVRCAGIAQVFKIRKWNFDTSLHCFHSPALPNLSLSFHAVSDTVRYTRRLIWCLLTTIQVAWVRRPPPIRPCPSPPHFFDAVSHALATLSCALLPSYILLEEPCLAARLSAPRWCSGRAG